MKKIEIKTTIVTVDGTAVTAEVIKQAIEDALRAVACDKNICYEVACIYDGKLEQIPSTPIIREVSANANAEPYENIDPYDPPYSYS